MFQTLLSRDVRTSYGLMLSEFAVITTNVNVVNNIDGQNNREATRLPV